jgi:hypothetical protein
MLSAAAETFGVGGISGGSGGSGCCAAGGAGSGAAAGCAADGAAVGGALSVCAATPAASNTPKTSAMPRPDDRATAPAPIAISMDGD